MRNKITRRCPDCDVDPVIVDWSTLIPTVYLRGFITYSGAKRVTYNCELCDKEFFYVGSTGIFTKDVEKHKTRGVAATRTRTGILLAPGSAKVLTCFECGSRRMKKYKQSTNSNYLYTCLDCQPLQNELEGIEEIKCSYCNSSSRMAILPSKNYAKVKTRQYVCVGCPDKIKVLA